MAERRKAQTGVRRPPPRPGALRTVADLTPDPDNANQGTQRGRAMVETSVRRYGFGRSVLVDRHGRLMAGHKTVEAAAATGNPDVVVVQTTGKQLVVVQRTDLDLGRDPVAKELAIADNRTTEVGLEWNASALQKLEASGADAKQFWRAAEWEKLLAAAVAVADADGIPEMALQPFEEYNYLMVVFKNSQDWQGACDVLGVQREAVTLGTTRKIGLGRVVDGAVLLETLCKSSSQVGSESLPSGATPSSSSPTPRSVSARVKRRRTAGSPTGSSSTPTT